jgi:hypothetical protein
MIKLPDFIIIGAGKCGTTSLQSYLNQHPQIYICPKKETYFFINDLVRSKLKTWGAITDIKDYLKLFEQAPESSIVGEISTNYYAYTESAKLIHKTIPKVKIIAILRDPSERAFSEYQMFVRNGNEKQDFASCLSENSRYVKRGFYHSKLLPFFEVFDSSQIKILLFDDFRENPIAFIQDLFRYIGVDDRFIPNISIKSREGGLPKNKTWHSLLTKPNPIRTSIANLLKPLMPLGFRQKIRSDLVKKNTYRVQLSSEEKNKLIGIYHQDILKLQSLIGRDLSAWLK